MSQLICIEYPGRVENVDRMLETLGGIPALENVFSKPNRRLELRFRPGDPYCKPACGEARSSMALLVKVKVVRGKKSGKIRILPEIVDRFQTSYSFGGMCDFQFLPMDTSGPARSIIDDVIIGRLMTSSEIFEAPADTKLHVPPAAFSRTDIPQDYYFRKDIKHASSIPENIIGRTRSRRSLYGIFVTYNVDKVPTSPHEESLNQNRMKFVDSASNNIVREKFAEKPVWLKSALSHITGVPFSSLKYILPTVAYYFTTGPWRNQWVRYGFDPRDSREAAGYQTLDYRIRVGGATRKLIKAKRNQALTLPYKTTHSSKARLSLISFGDPNSPSKVDEDQVKCSNEDEEKTRDTYEFTAGRMPPYRQMFYQYADIKIDAAQDLISKSAKSISEKCDEKNGWYSPGLDVKLRSMISESIKQHCFSSQVSQPTEANDDDDDEDDDDNNENSENITVASESDNEVA